ncbi:hypothetical protein FisN_6Hh267 [Fistulifera solaris]|jgi:hypothetical protein|uniref:Uncharacterized protein n=1 Tax=Fistulifera solaris TaxID=1519565 RepID=A0A1Z5K6X7_FISSO|nr:hypothetical protein FisN_6Hh267 [Fistulifera solaris]|eukprot:GAX22020.1 hypothetical protein FisN_6Hh267 [Fistulifera solaris]
MGRSTEPTNGEPITVHLPADDEHKMGSAPKQETILSSPKRVDHGSLLANLQREISKTQSRINVIRTRRRDAVSSENQEVGNRALSYHSGTHVGSTDTSSSRSKTANDQQAVDTQPTTHTANVPPVDEVLVLVECISDKSCSTAGLLEDAEQRVEFLTNKLEASDDLMEALFKDLQEAQDQNMVLQLQNAELNQAIDATTRKTVKTEAFELLMEQCVILKYAIVAGLVFFLCGQTEIFLACVAFLWLSLVVVTKDV